MIYDHSKETKEYAAAAGPESSDKKILLERLRKFELLSLRIRSQV